MQEKISRWSPDDLFRADVPIEQFFGISDPKVVRLPALCLPLLYTDFVREELGKMLDAGALSPFSSS